MKKADWASISDMGIFALNTISTVALLFFLWVNLVRSHDGSYVTSIQLEGFGGNFSMFFGVDIITLLALTIVFLLTQIYMNLRAISRRSLNGTKKTEVEAQPEIKG